MPLFGRSLPLSLPSIIIATSKKLRFSSLAAGILLFLLIGQSGRMQAQTGAAPASGQIIVKIKPSLASEAERQLSNVAAGQPMKIRAGQGGTPRIISFLGDMARGSSRLFTRR
jgi:hypothetical protein